MGWVRMVVLAVWALSRAVARKTRSHRRRGYGSHRPRSRSPWWRAGRARRPTLPIRQTSTHDTGIACSCRAAFRWCTSAWSLVAREAVRGGVRAGLVPGRHARLRGAPLREAGRPDRDAAVGRRARARAGAADRRLRRASAPRRQTRCAKTASTRALTCSNGEQVLTGDDRCRRERDDGKRLDRAGVEPDRPRRRSRPGWASRRNARPVTSTAGDLAPREISRILTAGR